MNQPKPQASRIWTRTIRGNSMDKAGLVPGTIVYVDSGRVPVHRDIVAAFVAGKGHTVKRVAVTKANGRAPGAWLLPESSNTKWKPTRMGEGVALVGVVVAYRLPGDDTIHQSLGSGFPDPPAPVIHMADRVAAGMLVGHALAQKDMPPLLFYLLAMRHRVWGIRRSVKDWGGAPLMNLPLEAYHPEHADMLEFARALGMDEGAWQMVMAGYVPEEAWLIRFAKRLTALTGDEVPAGELLRFAQGRVEP